VLRDNTTRVDHSTGDRKRLGRRRECYDRRMEAGNVVGWPAVLWVAGMGAGLLLSAAVLWIRAATLRDRPAVRATYRTTGTPGSDRASEARACAILLVVLFVLSQLLYIGVHIELLEWLLTGRDRPLLSPHLFFWVFLVNATCAGGALYTGLRPSD
jgi:hypothetical protein